YTYNSGSDGSWVPGALGTITSITLTQPWEGLTITDSGVEITATGTPTFALANDIGAIEALGGTGLAKRTGTDSWTLVNTVSVAEGGTGVSLSGTGGTGQVLKQSSTGGTITVGTLNYNDLANKPAALTSIIALSTSADKMIYTTASNTYAVTDLTTAGRALINVAGTAANNKIVYLTGSSGSGITDYTATARSIDGLSITAKGDLIVGSTSDTAVVKAVGTNGQVLTANSSVTGGVEWANLPADPGVADVRLSADSANAVTTTNSTNVVAVYLVPFRGNKISLYTGSAWVSRSIGSSIQLDISGGSYYQDRNWDVFAYDNAGFVALEAAQWDTTGGGNGTDSNTRVSFSLTLLEGVLVKNGSPTRRYVGTIRTTGVNGRTEDSDSKRFVFSMYNRKLRKLKAVDTTSTWTQTTTEVWREANTAGGFGISKAAYVCGVVEDAMTARVYGFASTSAATYIAVGIGLDGVSTLIHDTSGGYIFSTSQIVTVQARYTGFQSLGYHTLVWAEIVSGNTVTWRGSYAKAYIQCGLTGEVYQ
ncbi:MAG: hypothetical protein ACAI35_03550, partial [Candidatus Methylacidiphilales bacterium]